MPVDRVWCDVVFIRSVVALRSIVVLMNANAVDDAAIVLKSIFEIEFQLGAIKNDRQIAVDFILQAESARLKRLKRFRDSGRPLPEGMTVEEINRQLQEDRGEIKEVSKEFLAEHAKMGNEYAIFYSALSDVADSSPVGLRHYIEEGTSPGSVRINSSGSLLSPEFVMVLASSTQLEIFRIMREIRDDGIQDPDLQRLLLENGQIIDTVREKSMQ